MEFNYLTKEEIEEINGSCPYGQGIFLQPNGIPYTEKRLVIYLKWETGGVSGGSCWDSSNPQRYVSEEGEPEFIVLDKTLEKLCPKITYLEYKKLHKLIKSNSETDWEYYGNCTDWEIKYVVLDELYALLQTFN